MGEYADDAIDGLVCECCGVFMDDLKSPGYPRECADCEPDPHSPVHAAAPTPPQGE